MGWLKRNEPENYAKIGTVLLCKDFELQAELRWGPKRTPKKFRLSTKEGLVSHYTDIGTYVAYERIPGQVYGEGQGLFRTDEGEGVIWKGIGVGTPIGQGMGMKWSAAVTYQTNSKKLARLNGMLGMIEHETDAEGNAKVTALLVHLPFSKFLKWRPHVAKRVPDKLKAVVDRGQTAYPRRLRRLYCPARDPLMPPTLKNRLSTANTTTGGSIMTTATAITEPQSVAFCWKNDSRPSGRVNLVSVRKNTIATR